MFYGRTARDCLVFIGVRGEVEDVAAYMFDFAWNPAKISYESFWSDFAVRCFGEADAPEMAKLLMELDALGPRWTGATGQVECGSFIWSSSPNPNNLKDSTADSQYSSTARR